MSSRSTAITVAVIGGIATVGAALVASFHKGADPPPALQQTASGAGAVNVGRDAVFNNTIAKSVGEEAAERVQACEAAHGMKTSTERKDWEEKGPNRNLDAGSSAEHTDFHFCGWPKSRYADGDGYLEIKVTSVTGPGDSEASGEDVADRIVAPCPQVALTYQFGHMGYSENQAPFPAAADKIYSVDGKPWTGNRTALAFYPEPGEAVVLRSGHYGLEGARCP